MPVLMVADSELQERSDAAEQLRIPKLDDAGAARRAIPRAVHEAARCWWLPRIPCIVADRAARTPPA